MTANDRRMEIMQYLCEVRRATRLELIERFGVSHGTIDNDLCILSCSYPITIEMGRRGGVVVEDGYYLGKQFLNQEQESLLQKLAADAPDDQSRETLLSIIRKFSHKEVKKK